MKSIAIAEILYNNKLSDGIFEMIIAAEAIAKEAKAGQFVNVYTGLGENILPRPISISEIDKNSGTLTLIYQVVGKGTKCFSEFVAGQEIKVLGPLGNGFTIPSEEGNHVVVGGGIGAPPLIELMKALKGTVTVFLGARSNPILVEKFEALGATVHIATDDGNVGFKGNVVQLMDKIQPKADFIYSCGPKIMLKFLSQWAKDKGVNAQVSMEERMACGIGACVGCAVKIKKEGESDWQNLKVCKDGPVFMSNEVVWDE
ncbi:MAG: dihydroorotate dehydrogenase electron transfer subunit [Lachnospiraceae bacterium]|nr:dihydroorotate dehydrogenase electron transfer subunit [Lachnospiraceae bacterium]